MKQPLLEKGKYYHIFNKGRQEENCFERMKIMHIFLGCMENTLIQLQKLLYGYY